MPHIKCCTGCVVCDQKMYKSQEASRQGENVATHCIAVVVHTLVLFARDFRCYAVMARVRQCVHALSLVEEDPPPLLRLRRRSRRVAGFAVRVALPKNHVRCAASLVSPTGVIVPCMCIWQSLDVGPLPGCAPLTSAARRRRQQRQRQRMPLVFFEPVVGGGGHICVFGLVTLLSLSEANRLVNFLGDFPISSDTVSGRETQVEQGNQSL